MKKTVLLTGANGFLGSYLLGALLKEGHDVVILKRSSSDTWRINHQLGKLISYDVDKQPISLAFEQQHIDVVIHTACNYGRNQSQLSDIVESNLLFAIRVLEAAILTGVKTFLNTDTLLPRHINDYSLSKHQFSEWLKQSSEKIQCINFRIEHIYGPKDDENKFIYWLLNQMINEDKKIRLTKGEQKRDFIFIDDVISAYMMILSKASGLLNWNEFEVGSNKLISVKEFVLSLQSVVEGLTQKSLSNRFLFGAVPYREGEIMEPVIDNSALLKLGWQPHVSLESGLRKILKEFK